MNDAWTFGWTQLLTIVGFVITVTIAVSGFRTFGRWKRELLESKRIEIALEALALAYESKYVFESIRSPMSFGYEWADMPSRAGENESARNSRGAFYAIRKRVFDRKDFFEGVIKLQPKMMAMFGTAVEEPFMQLHRARREVEVASEMLEKDAARGHTMEQGLREQLEADIWSGYGEAIETRDGDKVGRKVQEFVDGVERLCRPIVDEQYQFKVPKGLINALFASVLRI